MIRRALICTLVLASLALSGSAPVKAQDPWSSPLICWSQKICYMSLTWTVLV